MHDIALRGGTDWPTFAVSDSYPQWPQAWIDIVGVRPTFFAGRAPVSISSVIGNCGRRLLLLGGHRLEVTLVGEHSTSSASRRLAGDTEVKTFNSRVPY